MNSDLALQVWKHPFQCVVGVRQACFRMVIESPQQRHITLDTQVCASQSWPHIRWRLAFYSLVVNPFVDDVLVLLVPKNVNSLNTFIEIFDKVIIYKFASTYVCSEYSFFQPLQSATFCGLLLSIPLCYSCSSIHFLTLLTAVVCQGDITHIVAHRYWILLEEWVQPTHPSFLCKAKFQL